MTKNPYLIREKREGGGEGVKGEGGRGGGGDTETKTVSQTVKRGKIQNSNHLQSTQSKARGTVNISK